MAITTRTPSPTHLRAAPARRRARAATVAVALAVALAGAACAPAPEGGVEFVGPVTVPLPPIGTTPPPVTVSLLGLCDVGYQPPAFTVTGATVTIPRVRIDPGAATVTVPDVVVNIPAATIGLPAVTLACLGLISLSTQVNVLVPGTARVGAAVIDLRTGVLTLADPSFTITGVGLGLPGIGGLVLPLPPLTLPLPTTTVPLGGGGPA